jgi:hypothetical protein
LLNRPSGTLEFKFAIRFCLPHCPHYSSQSIDIGMTTEPSNYEAERRGNARGNRQSRFVPSIESLLDSPKTRLAIASADS